MVVTAHNVSDPFAGRDKLDSANLSVGPFVANDYKAFKDELTLLKSHGIKLTPANLITIAHSLPSAETNWPDFKFVKDFINAYQKANPSVGLILESTPLSLIRENRMLLEASPELRPDVQRVNVTPFELRVEEGKDGKINIEIRNWMLPEDKSIIFKREVNYETESKEKLISDVIQGINRAAGNILANEKQLDKIQGSNDLASRWAPSITVNRAIIPTKDQKEIFRDIISKTVGNEIYIDVLPSGKPVDYYISSDSLPISESTLTRNGFSPIQVDGILEAISFDLPMSPALKSVAGKSFRDRFGNRVTCGQSIDGVMPVTIQPRLFLASEGVSPAQKGISIDLSPLGLGTVENLFYQKEIPFVTKLGSNGQYSIYTSCSLPEELERIPKMSAGITAGTSTAERLFGFAPGSLAKNIVIMPSEDSNAHFSAGNPDTVFVYYPQLLAGQSQVVGCHEAIHLISHRFGVSGGEWKKWFDFLRSDKEGDKFLTFISESLFSSNIKDTGHAYTDEDEFLASFVNGFRDTNWAKSVKDWPIGHKIFYKDSLLTLDSRLETLAEAYKKSTLPFNPVLLRAKIRERLDIITQMIFDKF